MLRQHCLRVLRQKLLVFRLTSAAIMVEIAVMTAHNTTTSTLCKEIRATQDFWARAFKWRGHFGSTTDSDIAKALINFAITELERQQNLIPNGVGDNGESHTKIHG